MKILADQYIFQLASLIPDQLQLDFFDPERGLPAEVTEYDALLIRSVTSVNKNTLPVSGKISFIGTATAGYDHLDLDYLKSLEIKAAIASGCNANSVAEYVVTSIFRWASTQGKQLTNLKAGIVGAGNVGTRLNTILQRLNIATVLYDPPRQEREPAFQSAALAEILDCDILSLHTSLTHKGPHATYHLCNKTWLDRGFDLVLNTARGGVVNEKDLLSAFKEQRVGNYILDAWENEPDFSDEMARHAFIATPHVAGYSKESKRRATEMVVNKFCDYFGIPAGDFDTAAGTEADPDYSVPDLPFDDFLWRVHNMEHYDLELRKLIGLPSHKKKLLFAKLRSETELRNEFQKIAKVVNEEKLPAQIKVFR